MATQWRLCVCSLGILLLAPCALSEIFSLAGSSHPVVGVFGRDVVLPCQLSPPTRVPNMDVLWKKIDTRLISVHEYSDKGPKDQPGQGYQTRTELFLQEFSSGNISLKLKQLQVADAGKYQCLVKNPDWTQEAITELQVAAVAPVFIDVLGPRDQGIALACRSSGWFPKPELQWVGKNWQKLAMEIKTNVTQERESLYSVVSHVTVTERENSGDISCIVRHDLVETQQQSAICLSGDVFPRASPWLAAFWVLFTLVLIAAGAYAYREYRVKRKKKPAKKEALLLLETGKKTLEAEFQDLLRVQEAERKAFDSERQELQEKFETLDKEKKALDLECQKLRETIESQKKQGKKEKEKKQDKKKEEKKQENKEKVEKQEENKEKEEKKQGENKEKEEKQEENKTEEKQEKEEKKKQENKKEEKKKEEKEKKEKEKKEQEKREKEKKEQEKKKKEEEKKAKEKEKEKKEQEKKKKEEEKKEKKKEEEKKAKEK